MSPASCRRSTPPAATEQLLPLVYELRKLAAAKLAQEKPGQSLQATALVHEVYLRLLPTYRAGSGGEADSSARSPPTGGTYNSRGHFFAAAAMAEHVTWHAETTSEGLKHLAQAQSVLAFGGGSELEHCRASHVVAG